MALQAVSLFWEPCFFRHDIISGSFFYEYLAKPCLSSKIIGRTVLASSSLCLVDEPTLNNRDRLKREADASAQRDREHSSKKLKGHCLVVHSVDCFFCANFSRSAYSLQHSP